MQDYEHDQLQPNATNRIFGFTSEQEEGWQMEGNRDDGNGRWIGFLLLP